MIAIECSRRNTLRERESVQLVEIRVADQVGPQPAVGGPDGVVDENGHAVILSGNAPEGPRFARTPGIR